MPSKTTVKKPVKKKRKNYIAINKKHMTIFSISNGQWVEEKPGVYCVKGRYTRYISHGKASRYSGTTIRRFSSNDFHLIGIDYN